MRIVLFVLVLAFAVGCAKKQPAAKAPAPEPTETKADEAARESATGAPDGAGGEVMGDPCDGGESKDK